jgi:hypothetical protein
MQHLKKTSTLKHKTPLKKNNTEKNTNIKA